MNIKKNDILKLEIIDLSKEGSGVAKIDNLVVFINDALIGDVVRLKVIKVKKKYLIGKLLEIIEPSPLRVDKSCEIRPKCGGCELEDMRYEEQLKFKQRLVEQTLKRIGEVDLEVQPIVGSEKYLHYRNKVQLPVREVGGEIRIGYYKRGSHDVIEYSCNTEHENNIPVINVLKDFMNTNNVKAYNEKTHSGLVRHLFTRVANDGEMSVTIVIDGDKLKASEILVENLSKLDFVKSISININKEKGNKILGDKTITLYGEPALIDNFAHLKYRISPNSFYQINKAQAEKIYSKAASYLDEKKENILDLYCGIGTISLFVANRAKKVIGIEIVEQAIVDARENAKLNDIENASFICGKAEEKISDLVGNEEIDVIIVDPPRKGLHEDVIKTIFEISPQKLIYVSCDVATLARDLKELKREYEIKKITPYDFFPMTMHTECIVYLSRK